VRRIVRLSASAFAARLTLLEAKPHAGGPESEPRGIHGGAYSSLIPNHGSDKRPGCDPKDGVGRVGRVARNDVNDPIFYRQRQGRELEAPTPAARQLIALKNAMTKVALESSPINTDRR
jgi:hypothetical protein